MGPQHRHQVLVMLALVGSLGEVSVAVIQQEVALAVASGEVCVGEEEAWAEDGVSFVRHPLRQYFTRYPNAIRYRHSCGLLMSCVML